MVPAGSHDEEGEARAAAAAVVVGDWKMNCLFSPVGVVLAEPAREAAAGCWIDEYDEWRNVGPVALAEEAAGRAVGGAIGIDRRRGGAGAIGWPGPEEMAGVDVEGLGRTLDD